MMTDHNPQERLDALADLFAEGLVAWAESGELGLDSFVGESGRKALISSGNEGNSVKAEDAVYGEQ